MIIVDLVVHKTESYPVTGILRVWGNMKENGKDELVREYKNCERIRLALDPKTDVRGRTEAGLRCRGS